MSLLALNPSTEHIVPAHPKDTPCPKLGSQDEWPHLVISFSGQIPVLPII